MNDIYGGAQLPPLQTPLQHSMPELQVAPVPLQPVAAWAGVGAKIEATTGRVTAAPTPKARRASRRLTANRPD
ncbi:MAG TPA: hypothetical protein VE863_14905 [Pyrinomonadaceae bacterium]|nr:hypothetical protein [Pyrinomonadaceae bacterium]